MWVLVVWLMQGLVSSTAGVYLNTACIRSLLKCTPFQLSLSDGKFSSNFIEDTTTLNRRCRSIDPLLECLQEAELQQCNSLNISPAEKEFIKTRLFIAEVCKDVLYTQKVYLRNAACINRERDWVLQACDPYEYLQLVNTSNLISLEGSCVFQNLLINCRRDVIQDKCGPDAADLYQRVKAVDMNLDFLCLDGRDLKSPKFMLDVTINSYISLLLETLRPVLIMESSYLKDIVQTSTEEESTTQKCTGRECLAKRSKTPAYFEQDVEQHEWRRFGDVPLETSTHASEDLDSLDEEYFPDPSLMGGTEPTIAEPVHVEDASIGTDSELGIEDSNSDGMLETTIEDSNTEVENANSGIVYEETSSEFTNEDDTESAPADYEQSNVKVILGLSIPHFEHAQVDATEDHNILDTTSTDLDTTEGDNIRSPCEIETSSDSDEPHDATPCPEYIESTSADLDADQVITTIYPDDHETPDIATLKVTPGDLDTSLPDLDAFKEGTTNFETITENLSTIEEINSLLAPSTETDVFNLETSTLYPSDHETLKADSITSEENILESTSSPETTKADNSAGSIFSVLKAFILSDEIENFFKNDSVSSNLKKSLQDWAERMKVSPDEETAKVYDKLRALSGYFESHKESYKTTLGINLNDEESSTSDMIGDILEPTSSDTSGYKEPTSSGESNLEGSSTENGSLEDEKRSISGDRIEGDKESEFYLNIGKEIEILYRHGVFKKLWSLFSPTEMEKRFGGYSYFPIDKSTFLKSRTPNDERLQKSIKPEEITSSNPFEASDATNVLNDSGKKAEEMSQSFTIHEEDGNKKNLNKNFRALTTIKSIAQLGVKLNYILIGESYIPLEFGYDDDGKFNHNLKIHKRKFKFYTSTPTDPSTRIARDSEFFSTEPTSLSELTVEDPESLSLSNDEKMSNSEGGLPDFNCPDVAGNLTPRTSHLVDPDKKLSIENCFSISDLGEEETRLDEDSSVEVLDKAEENPNETDQEFRRHGDIEEVVERIIPRNLDLETMVALKFYGEILTELAAMLPPGSPDSKTLAKRASSLVGVYKNYMKANGKSDPAEILRMALGEIKSKRFQKRSGLNTEGHYTLPKKQHSFGEVEEFRTVDGVHFIIGHSPESHITVEMTFNPRGQLDQRELPEANYIVIGESRLPVELHFTHKNKDYIHYTEIIVPKKHVPLRRAPGPRNP